MLLEGCYSKQTNQNSVLKKFEFLNHQNGVTNHLNRLVNHTMTGSIDNTLVKAKLQSLFGHCGFFEDYN